MIALQEVDLHRILVGGGYYFVSIAGVIVMSYYAVKSFRADIDKLGIQQERTESKVDAIQETLADMREAQARHDQMTENIQDRVCAIEGRVTYLERRD